MAGCSNGTPDATGTNPGDGKVIFSDAGCGGCHTLDVAGSKGTSGPDLSSIKLTAAQVADQVEHGGGGMPAYKGDLTPQQITSVSEFIAQNDGS